MATSLNAVIILSVLVCAIAQPLGQPKNRISSVLGAMCTTFKAELLEDGPCNVDFMEEVVDKADNVEGTTTVPNFTEEAFELFMLQAHVNMMKSKPKLCYENGNPVRGQCEAMQSVCDYASHIIPCTDVTVPPPTAGAATNAPTNAPTQPITIPPFPTTI